MLPEEVTQDSESRIKIALIPIYDPDKQVGLQQGENPLDVIKRVRHEGLGEIGRVCGTYAAGGGGLLWAINHIATEVGQHFDAHGLSKGNPVEVLNDILTKGITSFHTVKLGTRESPEAAHPCVTNGIILVSEYDKYLLRGVKLRDGRIKGTIKYVVVGEEYMDAVDLLRKMYPQVTIVPWYEAPRVLTEAVNTHLYTDFTFRPITETDRPSYPLPSSKRGRGKIIGNGGVLIPEMTEEDSMTDIW